MPDNEPVIVTFYSYKGGVGRSMAIANVACVLARDYGKRVLLVDWDLEAPGLHRFFGLESESLGPGLMDILDDYKALLTKDIEVLPEQLVKLDKYINTAGMPSYRSGGSVALVGAGLQDEKYAGRVNSFSWDDFYKKWHGFGFIEYLKGELKKKADVVLLDSRTGVTDIGGICTLQLPDVVVLMFALNYQNITGVETIAKSIRERAAKLAKRETPPKIIVRPARVEIFLEETLMRKWQGIAAKHLGQHVPAREGDPLRYMAKKGIPYIGAYSFGETLAVSSNELGPLAEAYESLASSVVEAAGIAGSGEEASGHGVTRLLSAGLGNAGRGLSAILSSRAALRTALWVMLPLLVLSFFAAADSYSRLRAARLEVGKQEQQRDELKRQVEETEARISELRKTLDALSRGVYSPGDDAYPPPSIDYCSKNDAELQKVESALNGLGFKMRRIPAPNDVPVNSVFFGSDVDPEDVRQVAIRLLQSGVQLKGIYRFRKDSPKRDGTSRATLIELVGSRPIEGRPPLTKEVVRNMERFDSFAAQTP